MSISTQPSAPHHQGRALVLGGGGPVGRAWETGLAAGFAHLGVNLSTADLIVGTSAGAIVGAEIALGRDMKISMPVAGNPAAGRSVAPAPAEPPPGLQELMAAIAQASTSPDPEAARQRIGQIALSASVPDEKVAIGRPNLAGVSGQPWPTSLQATSVSTKTGRRQVWNASSNVPLEKALAASSALPGVWPPITIGDDRYMDGGVSSTLNADLAQNYGHVIVVSCFGLHQSAHGNPTSPANKQLITELETLRRSGASVELISPNSAFLALTRNGALMLNPALEPQASELGNQQASREIERVRAAWTSQL
jgi:NTE family protein